MNLLSVRQLSKTFDDYPVLDDITFHIHKGQKLALIAKNGSGKTTLIRILAGLETADQGEVIFQNDLEPAFVFQDTDFEPGLNVSQAIFSSEHPSIRAISDYEKALSNPNDSDALQDAFGRMEDLQAWDYHLRVKQVISQLKLDDFLERPVAQLSGGQQKRISLARALIEEPEFVILDEPTNHLDLDMIEWLENYLDDKQMTLLMVTHDRYFLERICEDILELDRGRIYHYSGNFSSYIEQKAMRIQQADKVHQSAKNLYQQELKWIRKQPRARGTKSRSRSEAFYDLEAQVKGREKSEKLVLEFETKRLGGKILVLDKIKKSFDHGPLFENLSYTFNKGDRIGIIGKNGVGKTTFLNTIMGDLDLDSGSIEHGETVCFGYYRQMGFNLDLSQRVIDLVRDVAEFLPLAKGKTITAAQLLERFLFTPQVQYRRADSLSGGEQKRLFLLTILMKNPNFLILDEPTNDLDIDTIQILEDFLSEYPGCLLVVSHDRYFMDKMVNHLFVFEGQGAVRYFSGSYSDYWEAQQLAEKQAQVKKVKVERTKSAPKKLSFKQAREKDLLEKKMADLEKEKQALEAEMNQTQDYELLQEHSKKHQALQDDVDEAEMSWLILAELEESFSQ